VGEKDIPDIHANAGVLEVNIALAICLKYQERKKHGQYGLNGKLWIVDLTNNFQKKEDS
jgi:hypothetical protein